MPTQSRFPSGGSCLAVSTMSLMVSVGIACSFGPSQPPRRKSPLPVAHAKTAKK
jgi:hypothetical protein